MNKDLGNMKTETRATTPPTAVPASPPESAVSHGYTSDSPPATAAVSPVHLDTDDMMIIKSSFECECLDINILYYRNMIAIFPSPSTLHHHLSP